MATSRRKTKSQLGISDSNVESSAESSAPESPPVKKRGSKIRALNLIKNDASNSQSDEAPNVPFIEKKISLDEIIEIESSKYFNYGKPIIARGQRGKKTKTKTKAKGNGGKTTKKLPQLMPDTLREYLEDADDDLLMSMKDKHTQAFDRWMMFLSEGANILLTGYGSKLDLLEEFRQTQLVKNGYNHLVIHGYRPNVRIKHLLDTLETSFKLVMPEKSTNSGIRHRLVQRAHDICHAFNGLREKAVVDFLIIIHSIDGVALRDDESQTVLSYLAQLKNCRILASVDHVNASLIWDHVKLDRFRWMHIRATTYASYKNEIVNGHGSKMLGLTKKSNLDGGSHTLAGLQSIWASINKNAQAVFIKLAKNQLANGKRRVLLSNLMTFWELFNSCRQDFIISNEATLRQFLSEFEDHNLLKIKFNSENRETFQLNIDGDLLAEFLSSQGVHIDDGEMENGNGSVINGNQENRVAENGETSDSDSEEAEENNTVEDNMEIDDNDDENGDAFDDLFLTP